MIYQDEAGLLDLPLPNLIGAHQVRNAGGAIAALRHLGFDAQICEAAITTAQWPARMQRLHHGPLIDIAPEAEIWLDGGHNPAAAAALVEALSRLPRRPTHIICGMLNTKDVAGFITPIADISDSFRAVSIPDQAATLSDDETVAIARAIGVMATACPDVQTALSQIIATDPLARVVICGSLYLAGTVLRENG
jgi:dihydrofolate synthase/folylpolyglutamate synthase